MAKPTFLSKIIGRALDDSVSKHYANNYPNRTLIPLNWETAVDYFKDWRLKTATHEDFGKYLKAYGSNPLLYMIVNKIAYNSASIQRIAVNEQGEEIESSQLLEILSNPNPDQNGIEFKEQWNEYAELTGNVYIHWIQGIGGFGLELRILETDRVDIICNARNEIRYYQYTKPNGSMVKIEPEDIMHFKYSNSVNTEGEEAKYGMSPAQPAWVVIEASAEKFNAEASIFKNRGISKILTNDTDVPMTPKQRDRVQAEVNKALGGSDKFNGVHVSNTSLRALELGMSPTDLKLLEGITSSLRQLCAIWSMPSVLFNDNDNSTYNNVSEAKVSAYNDKYIPLADRFNEAFTSFANEKLGTNETIINDLNSIEEIKASQNEVMQALNGMDAQTQRVVVSQLTTNEIRSLLPGVGDLPEGEQVIGMNPQSNEGETEED